jgi:hypothetical protein
MNETTLRARVRLFAGLTLMFAIAAAFAMFLWMTAVRHQIDHANRRIANLEAMHGAVIEGANHDAHK